MPPDGWSKESSVDVGCPVFKLCDENVCSKPADPETDLQSCANHRVRPDECETPYALRSKPLPLKLGRARIHRRIKLNKGTKNKVDTTQANQIASQSANTNVNDVDNVKINVNVNDPFTNVEMEKGKVYSNVFRPVGSLLDKITFDVDEFRNQMKGARTLYGC
jgi:hypothetical protein